MPGRPGQALQGFAVDGRKVVALQLSVQVRAKEVRSGQTAEQLPDVVVRFYDENRVPISEEGLGPWHGTFDWQSESKRLNVPLKAREAIMRIGLFGAVGEISFDDLEMKPVKK